MKIHTVALFAMNPETVASNATLVTLFQLTPAYPQSALWRSNMCCRFGVGYCTKAGLKAIVRIRDI
jgi:hypothetical protein